MVCMKGYSKFAEFLIKKYIEYGFSLHPLDKRKDTPLLLISSHGHDHENLDNEEEYDRFLNQKFKIIEMLVENDPQAFEEIHKNKNNPLHWAIYYGDVNSGIYLFKKCPQLLLHYNDNGKTPLEIVFQKTIKKTNKLKSKQLVKCIVEEFLHAMFVEDEISAEPAMQEVISQLNLIKNQDHIYDTDKLVNRLFVLKSGDIEDFAGGLDPLMKFLNKNANLKKFKPEKNMTNKIQMPFKFKNLESENESVETHNSEKDILKERSLKLSNFIQKDEDFEKVDLQDYETIHVDPNGKYSEAFNGKN